MIYVTMWSSNIASNAVDRHMHGPTSSPSFPWPPIKVFHTLNEVDDRFSKSTTLSNAAATMLLLGVFVAQWKYSPLIRYIRQLKIGDKGDGKKIQNFNQFMSNNLPPLLAFNTNFYLSSVIAGAATPLVILSKSAVKNANDNWIELRQSVCNEFTTAPPHSYNGQHLIPVNTANEGDYDTLW